MPAVAASCGALGHVAAWFHHLAAVFLILLSLADDSTDCICTKEVQSTCASEERSFSFHFNIFLFVQNTLSGCERKKSRSGLQAWQSLPAQRGWLTLIALQQVKAEDQVLLCISSPSQEMRYKIKRQYFIKHSSWKVTLCVHV